MIEDAQTNAAGGVATYGVPAYDVPNPPAVKAKTNGLAIAAFVLSLCSVALPGLICGIIAARQIDRTGGRQKGRGLATAAIVISSLWLFFVVVVYAVAASNSGY